MPIGLFNAQKAFDIMIRDGDSLAAAGTSLLIGSCFTKLGKYRECTETLFAFLPYVEKIHKPGLLANYYSNLGNVYNYMNRNNEAYSYYLKAIELMEKNDLTNAKYVNTLNNTGIIFYSDFQVNPEKRALIDSSIKYSNKAMQLAQKIGHHQGVAMALGNIGMAYESIEDYKMALKYYLESLDISKKIGIGEGIAFANNNLGYIYEKLGNYSNAIEHFNSGLSLARELQQLDIAKDSYFGMSETYVKTGDYKKAHEQYLLYAQVKDSLFTIESNNQISELQTRFETDKKEKQLQIKTLELAKKETEVKKQRLMIWAVISGLVIVFVFAFFIYSRFRIIRKQKKIIENQKQVVDEKNKHLEEAKEIIEEKNKDILDSIRYAKRIQEAILPGNDYLERNFGDHFILFKPKDIVSGDFYWAYKKHNDLLIWAAADCTGHGVPGAFMSMIGNSLLNEIIVENGVTESDKILNKLREGIIRALGQTGEAGKQKDGMDMALCIFNRASFTLEYSGANNPLWIFKPVQNGSPVFIEIPADKQPVGIFTDMLKPFTKHSLQLQAGDIIYSFTDGFADQFGGPKGKKFKYSQLRNLLSEICPMPMHEQQKILLDRIENWKGPLEQVDDICVIGMRV